MIGALRSMMMCTFSFAVIKKTNSTRCDRFDHLNALIGKDKQSFSALKTNTEICDYYNGITRSYNQTKQSVDSTTSDFVLKLLSLWSQTASTKYETEYMLYPMIAFIIASICVKFPGSRISVAEPIEGTNVHVHGDFEFVIEIGKFKVCIVEGKKEAKEQGTVQGLLGCEVLADISGLPCVLCIVTTYTNWIFLKSYADRIEKFEWSMEIAAAPYEPQKASLENLLGLLNSFLSEFKS